MVTQTTSTFFTLRKALLLAAFALPALAPLPAFAAAPAVSTPAVAAHAAVTKPMAPHRRHVARRGHRSRVTAHLSHRVVRQAPAVAEPRRVALLDAPRPASVAACNNISCRGFVMIGIGF